MKTMSKRNKILYGVLGAVVVVVAAGLVLGLTGNLPLQGGPFSANLTPDKVCLEVGTTQTFTLSNYRLATSWRINWPGVEKVSSDRTHFTAKGVTAASSGSVGLEVFGTAGSLLDKSLIAVRANCFECQSMNTPYVCLP